MCPTVKFTPIEPKPAILYFYDRFQKPPFDAWIAVSTEDVIGKKSKCIRCTNRKCMNGLVFRRIYSVLIGFKAKKNALPFVR